jgi:2-oxoglutarate ferredoxin oxidoreductase subunit gamma
MTERYRFLFSGSGGQGVISMGILLAEAAVLHDGLIAVQTQSYGPEARGGATRCDVVVSNGPIHFPKVLQPNILIALTQEACTKYLSLLRPGGLFVSDTRFVSPGKRVDARHKELPMYETLMERIGKPQAFNICVLGAVNRFTKLVRMSSLEKVLETRFAPAFYEANRAALRLGEELAAPLEDDDG